MNNLKLNETPVRTSRNFNINNIKLDDIKIPEEVGSFDNIKIIGETSKVNIEKVSSNCNLVYGLGDILTNQVNNQANQKFELTIDSKLDKEIQLDFKFDKDNLILVDNIEIIANESTKATIILKYESNENIEGYHNGILRVNAKKDSNINIIIVNLMNSNSDNFMAIENTFEENAKVKYTIVDFGGKNSITNYYSNLLGKKSENILNTIYLGKENQLFDLNYIGELKGEKSNIDIEVQGALKDKAKKHFKGTIDFKKGCKKAKGNENEACMLLSDNAKSLALPMLLCSEEDVEGNHSTSAGKIGEKELFYIMSRGFELKEAQKLMVRAKFNKILENIKNEELKEEILNEIDKRLD
jgi:Fe-S cluster assembly scaffold protein SufB